MLDFLVGATIEDVAEQTGRKSSGPRKETNPEGLAIRLFRDGSVYPSADLVALLNLEYPQATVSGKTALPLKDGETETDTKYRTVFEVKDDTSMGLDIIDSALYPSFKIPKRVLLANVALKSQPKVDLFARVDYEEDGTPKSSVMEQGSKTFGFDSLIPMLEEVYGIKMSTKADGVDGEGKAIKQWSDGPTFVDFTFIANPVDGQPWAKEVTYIPKKVSRGTDKGQVTTQRRESASMYVIMPTEVLEQMTKASEAKSTELSKAPISTTADGLDGKAEETVDAEVDTVFS